MSKNHQREIQCPKCGRKSSFTIWDSVNVSLNPELKEKIIDQSLFNFHCPSCKKNVLVQYPLIYHDMDRKLWFSKGPIEVKSASENDLANILIESLRRKNYTILNYQTYDHLGKLINDYE
jgi:predicted RNA-binding Zn-ribbon protein involved in translation (DUF1610 family)